MKISLPFPETTIYTILTKKVKVRLLKDLPWTNPMNAKESLCQNQAFSMSSPKMEHGESHLKIPLKSPRLKLSKIYISNLYM